jgi:hypothetical protein
MTHAKPVSYHAGKHEKFIVGLYRNPLTRWVANPSPCFPERRIDNPASGTRLIWDRVKFNGVFLQKANPCGWLNGMERF